MKYFYFSKQTLSEWNIKMLDFVNNILYEFPAFAYWLSDKLYHYPMIFFSVWLWHLDYQGIESCIFTKKELKKERFS